MPELGRYTLAWSPCIRHTNCMSAKETKHQASSLPARSLRSPFIARTAPARHAKNAGRMAKRRTGLPPCRSLTLLINDLRMRRADDQEHVVLVLDDYPVITTESIHHALSLRSLLGCDNVANFITAFSGRLSYVMDYLLDEVLSRQSKAVQDFLVQISLLEHGMDLVKGTRLVDQKITQKLLLLGTGLSLRGQLCFSEGLS